MGYTSKQLDQEMWFTDIELILTLEGHREELNMKKRAASIAMAFGPAKEKKQNGRRNR
jgi:hypothetical protein